VMLKEWRGKLSEDFSAMWFLKRGRDLRTAAAPGAYGPRVRIFAEAADMKKNTGWVSADIFIEIIADLLVLPALRLTALSIV